MKIIECSGTIQVVDVVIRVLQSQLKNTNMNKLIRIAIVMLALGWFCLASAIGQNVYRCGAMTTKNTPCKMRVKTLGAKCYHHSGNGSTNATATANDAGQTIHLCGALTAKGLPCKRRVKLSGAKCYSHQ